MQYALEPSWSAIWVCSVLIMDLRQVSRRRLSIVHRHGDTQQHHRSHYIFNVHDKRWQTCRDREVPECFIVAQREAVGHAMSAPRSERESNSQFAEATGTDAASLAIPVP